MLLEISYSEAIQQVLDDPEIIVLMVVVAILMLTAGTSSAEIRDDGRVIKTEPSRSDYADK